MVNCPRSSSAPLAFLYFQPEWSYFAYANSIFELDVPPLSTLKSFKLSKNQSFVSIPIIRIYLERRKFGQKFVLFLQRSFSVGLAPDKFGKGVVLHGVLSVLGRILQERLILHDVVLGLLHLGT